MSVLVYFLNVLLIVLVLVLVLVLGGATAGIYALVGYGIARARVGGLGEPFARHTYRRSGVVLMGVGTLAVLVAIPRYFASDGPVPGTWGTVLGGVAMVAIGRLLMIRFRRTP